MYSAATWFGLALVVASVSACGNAGTSAGGTDPGAGDPPGTVTTALMAEGNGPDSMYFETGAITTATVNGAPVVCLLGDGTDLGLDAGFNFQACSGSIADVGGVHSLADVTVAPTSGYVKSAGAVIGDGYVVNTATNNLYRFRVVKEVVGSGGKALGVELKWAPLGAACAASLTRCGGACVDTHSDVENCGGCGVVCPGLDAGAGCGPYGTGGAVVCTGAVKSN